jgi:hypothetical protein
MLVTVVIAVFTVTHLGTAPTAQRRATPTAPAGPLVIRPAQQGIDCPLDAAWSGDGTQIAVLGTTTCGEQQGQGVLNVYNVPAGKLIAQGALDDAAQTALATVNTDDIRTLTLTYTHVLWLGPTIYVTFDVTDTAAKADSALPFVGFLRANPSDLQPFAYVQPSSGSLNVYRRWSPISGSVDLTRDAIVGADGSVFASLPPSLAYGWNEGGEPISLAPVTAGRRPSPDLGGPIGDPSGDARLSIWQPGRLSFDTTQDGFGVYLFSTDFAAFSGGQPFLFDPVRLEGVLAPADRNAPAPTVLGELHLLQAPWLPVRDAALQAVMDTNPLEVVLAWRPNGAVLAAQAATSNDRNGNPTQPGVTLYDTASGHVLATLQPPPQPAGAIPTVNTLRWTSDGSALLLLDRFSSSVIVWGSSLLPR